MIFVMFVCLFDYVIVTFISKYFYLLFVCFIHVFSLELAHGRSLKLVGLMKEAFQAKGCKLGVFTSCQPLHKSSPFLTVSSLQPLHESSPFLAVSSRQPLHESSTSSRVVTFHFYQELQLFIFEQFSYFRHNFVYRCPN